MTDEKISAEQLLEQIRGCRLCEDSLPLGPRPVLNFHEQAKILVVGQAPGTRVHETGIPWNDPSGDRLRHWLNVSREDFYDPQKFSIVPMGFCYPGKGKSGDLPPRPECAQTWHHRILDVLPNLELILLIGNYAHQYFLGRKRYKTLTATIRHWKEFYPPYLPLVHPSPRNTVWLRKNPWFEKDVIPHLQERVRSLI